jgi:hypothetical protein
MSSHPEDQASTSGPDESGPIQGGPISDGPIADEPDEGKPLGDPEPPEDKPDPGLIGPTSSGQRSDSPLRTGN